MRVFACVLLLVAARPLFAQQAPANPQVLPPGQVTGRVFCADTGQPGRFAGVQLISEQPSKTPVFDAAALGKDPDFEKVFAKALSSVMKGSNLSAVTGLDGTFTLDKVPPGTYYAVAQLAGYESTLGQFSQLERVKADDATLKAVERAAEKIVVQPNQAARVEIRLVRGASISGVIRYDDGSPAPGVVPVLMVQDKDGKWKELGPSGMLPTSTDDRGHYRFYGIQAGKYAVKATLPTMQTSVGLGASVSLHMNLGDALVVYSGGALREKDVKPIELGTGENIDGIDVVFPLDNLHAISGTVVAKADSHPVDSGMVELEDTETKAKIRAANIEQDGSFHLNYVPDGQYVLRVSAAADTDTAAGGDSGGDFARLMHSKTIKSYGSAELPILLKSDSTGLILQVPDQSAAPNRGTGAQQMPPTP
jgi:hypothetical protein